MAMVVIHIQVKMKIKGHLRQKFEWKQTGGRTRPIAILCRLTRSVIKQKSVPEISPVSGLTVHTVARLRNQKLLCGLYREKISAEWNKEKMLLNETAE